MTTSLRDALRAFDGKAVSCLSEARVKYEDAPDYLAQLVALAAESEAEISAGATWMLKDHLENGGSLPSELVAPVLRNLTQTPSWSTALHLLQSVQYLDLGGVSDPGFSQAVVEYTGHERPFLRAWAVDALWRLSTAHSNLRPLAENALETAANDPAASVRARARQIAKEKPR